MASRGIPQARFVEFVRSGRLEVALAGLLAILAVSFDLANAQPWQPLALDLAACAAAALTARWRTAGVLLGAILLGYVAIPAGWATLGEYALLIPILGAGMRGATRAQAVMAIGYFAILAANAWVDAPSATSAILGWTAWAALIAVLWLIGRSFVAVAEAHRKQREADLVLQRQALARELHDTVARSLTMVTMGAERARLRGSATDADLAAIAEAAHDSIRELRLVMNLLRDPSEHPPSPDVSDTGLQEALQAGVAKLEQHGFPVSLGIEGDLGRLAPPQAAALGRATGEAVANIIKHADPNAPCAILVELDDSEVELAFLNRPTTNEPTDSQAGLGLWGMRQQLASLGGRVATQRTPTQWLTRIQLPMDVEPAHPGRSRG